MVCSDEEFVAVIAMCSEVLDVIQTPCPFFPVHRFAGFYACYCKQNFYVSVAKLTLSRICLMASHISVDDLISSQRLHC